MIKRLILLFFFNGLIGFHLAGQSDMDSYIQQALESNIQLQEHQYSYEQSLAELKEARRMFFPTVSLGQINPAYPSIQEYPEIENYIINFVRETEQETKVQNHLVDVEQMSVDIQKRELVKEVKKAYYHYLNSLKVVELYEHALETVLLNVSNTESLVTNDKVTLDELYVASAKVTETEKDLLKAKSDSRMAQAYFNVLLYRDLAEEILVDEDIWVEEILADQETLTQKALQEREELELLRRTDLPKAFWKSNREKQSGSQGHIDFVDCFRIKLEWLRSS